MCGTHDSVMNPVVGDASRGLYYCKGKPACRGYFERYVGRSLVSSVALRRVADGLSSLMGVQKAGASHLPDQLKDYDQADFRTAALGAFVDLGELVNECQWKPWRSYGPITDEEKAKVLKEYGDVLHFLAWMTNNLASRFGFSVDDFARGFVEVHEENVRRFRGEVPGREPPPPTAYHNHDDEMLRPKTCPGCKFIADKGHEMGNPRPDHLLKPHLSTKVSEVCAVAHGPEGCPGYP
jgi:hypothetical protein